ncbi:hypothetical protein Q7P37_002715 [Cladosporium fusiforme]
MMSAARLPCHKLCPSNATALRRIRVVPTCTNIARLYSTPSAPRDAHHNLLKKRIQDINADPNITDLQKYTNSIRLHYDIEFLQSLHKAEIQVQHFRELFRQIPPASDTLQQWDDALRKLDVVLEDVSGDAHPEGFTPDMGQWHRVPHSADVHPTCLEDSTLRVSSGSLITAAPLVSRRISINQFRHLFVAWPTSNLTKPSLVGSAIICASDSIATLVKLSTAGLVHHTRTAARYHSARRREPRPAKTELDLEYEQKVPEILSKPGLSDMDKQRNALRLLTDLDYFKLHHELERNKQRHHQMSLKPPDHRSQGTIDSLSQRNEQLRSEIAGLRWTFFERTFLAPWDDPPLSSGYTTYAKACKNNAVAALASRRPRLLHPFACLASYLNVTTQQQSVTMLAVSHHPFCIARTARRALGNSSGYPKTPPFTVLRTSIRHGSGTPKWVQTTHAWRESKHSAAVRAIMTNPRLTVADKDRNTKRLVADIEYLRFSREWYEFASGLFNVTLEEIYVKIHLHTSMFERFKEVHMPYYSLTIFAPWRGVGPWARLGRILGFCIDYPLCSIGLRMCKSLHRDR